MPITAAVNINYEYKIKKNSKILPWMWKLAGKVMVMVFLFTLPVFVYLACLAEFETRLLHYPFNVQARI